MENGEMVKKENKDQTRPGYNYYSIQEKVNKLLSTEITYIVKKGDTLTSIANKHNSTVERLVQVNNIKNPNLIYVNQILKIKQVT